MVSVKKLVKLFNITFKNKSGEEIQIYIIPFFFFKKYMTNIVIVDILTRKKQLKRPKINAKSLDSEMKK